MKQVQIQRTQTSGASGWPAAQKVVQPGPFTEQESLEPGYNHIVGWGHVVKAVFPTPPEPISAQVAVDPRQKKAAKHRKEGRLPNLYLKPRGP